MLVSFYSADRTRSNGPSNWCLQSVFVNDTTSDPYRIRSVKLSLQKKGLCLDCTVWNRAALSQAADYYTKQPPDSDWSCADLLLRRLGHTDWEHPVCVRGYATNVVKKWQQYSELRLPDVALQNEADAAHAVRRFRTLLDRSCHQVWTERSPSIALDENGNAIINVTDIDGGSSDNCEVASIELNITSFDCSNVGISDS